MIWDWNTEMKTIMNDITENEMEDFDDLLETLIEPSILLNQMIVLFLIICTGYIAYKLDYLDSASTKKLNKLVINITLPATILNSVLTMEQKPSGSTVIQIFVIYINCIKSQI